MSFCNGKWGGVETSDWSRGRKDSDGSLLLDN